MDIIIYFSILFVKKNLELLFFGAFFLATATFAHDKPPSLYPIHYTYRHKLVKVSWAV